MLPRPNTASEAKLVRNPEDQILVLEASIDSEAK